MKLIVEYRAEEFAKTLQNTQGVIQHLPEDPNDYNKIISKISYLLTRVQV